MARAAGAAHALSSSTFVWGGMLPQPVARAAERGEERDRKAIWGTQQGGDLAILCRLSRRSLAGGAAAIGRPVNWEENLPNTLAVQRRMSGRLQKVPRLPPPRLCVHRRVIFIRQAGGSRSCLVHPICDALYGVAPAAPGVYVAADDFGFKRDRLSWGLWFPPAALCFPTAFYLGPGRLG